MSDATLARFAQLDQLRDLGIDGNLVSNDGLAVLKKMRRLEILYAYELVVDDAYLAKLSGLSGLKQLTLNPERISDEGLAHLKSLVNLEELQLGVKWVGGPEGRSMISSEGLAYLAGMRRLKTLLISGSRITTLAPIRHLVSLRHLSLESTAITDEGLAPIANLVDLESLNLSRTEITDAGVAYLANLPRLERLSLLFTKVTDIGITRLGTLPRLGSLEVSINVSDEAIDSLKAKIPGLQVESH